jgi:hypothetical protein
MPRIYFPSHRAPYPAQITWKYAWPTSKRTEAGKQIQTDARTRKLPSLRLPLRSENLHPWSPMKSSPWTAPLVARILWKPRLKTTMEARLGMNNCHQSLCFAVEIVISAAAGGAWS